MEIGIFLMIEESAQGIRMPVSKDSSDGNSSSKVFLVGSFIEGRKACIYNSNGGITNGKIQVRKWSGTQICKWPTRETRDSLAIDQSSYWP